MANTYYKYVEKTADDFVDWSAIGKQMSNVFTETNKVREETKADIDEKSRQYGIELSEPPQGESVTGNQYALDLANEATSAKLMQLNLLKSGQLKLKDYLVQNQNLKDGTKDAFSVMKEFQENYKTTMDRMKADQSQDLEGFLHAEAEGFGDFTKSKLYINPTDFTVSVAMKDKTIDANGRETYAMSKNPNQFTTISALRNRIKGRFDKYDVAKNMAGFVAGLGEETNALVKIKNSYGATGIVSLLTDITTRKNLPKDVQGVLMKFEDAETKALQAQLTNPFNVTSILTNSIMNAPNGQHYTFTWDKAQRDKNSNLILLTNKSDGTPMPVFTDEQEKAALEHLRLQARLMYDKKEKIETTNQLQAQYAPEYVSKGKGEAKDKEAAVSAWNTLYYGKTLAEKDAAAKILIGIKNATNPDNPLTRISFPKKGVIRLEYEDTKKNIDKNMLDAKGNPISIEQWAALGNEVHGEDDVRRAMKAGGGRGKYVDIGDDWLKVEAKRQGKPEKAVPETPFEKYGAHIENVITPNLVKSKDSKIVAEKLNSKLTGLGLSIKTNWYNNKIYVEKSDGEKSEEFDLNTIDEEDLMSGIKDYIKNNPPGEDDKIQEDNIKKLIQTGVVKPPPKSKEATTVDYRTVDDSVEPK